MKTSDLRLQTSDLRKQSSVSCILPVDVDKYYFIEDVVKQIMHLYDFYEIRTTILQSNAIYKEYIEYSKEFDQHSIVDRLLTVENIDNLCLRPEGTLSILNSPIIPMALKTVQKVFYMGEMFQRPQNTDLRPQNTDLRPQNTDLRQQNHQYYQIGAEILGSKNVISDIEIIHLAKRILTNLGLTQFNIEINSYGCSRCFKRYVEAVKDYILAQDGFCPNCQATASKHPLHIYKCQNKKCQKLAKMSPISLDYLCEDCLDNFKEIKKLLSNLGTEFQINPTLSMKFDYYTRMMFNIYITAPTAEVGQNESAPPVKAGYIESAPPTKAGGGRGGATEKLILASGGRYDTLASHITQTLLPAVGMSLDIELLMKVMQEKKLFKEKSKDFRICICTASINMELLIVQVAQEIHDANINTVIFYDPISADEISLLAKKHNCTATLLFIEDLIREGNIMFITFDQNQDITHQDKIPLADIMENIKRINKTRSNK